MGDETIDILQKQRCNLHSLYLANMPPSPEQLHDWSTTTLTTLSLFRNRIGDEGAKALAQNTTLTTLDLVGNNIGDEGAKALAQNTTLTTLYLGGNNIGDEGAKALAQNTTLTRLSLYWNHIGVEGAKALAQNTTLTELYIGGNNIGAEELKILEEMLKRNKRLRMLEALDKIRPYFVERKVVPLQRLIKQWVYSDPNFAFSQRLSNWG